MLQTIKRKAGCCPMLFSKAIEGFILYANAGHYSPAYVPTLRGYLKYMCKYFGDPEIESLTSDDWQKYFTHLHTEYQPKRFNKDTSPLSEASIDNHWKTMRGFYNWVIEALEISRPDLKIARPKFESPQVRAFSKEDIAKLVAGATYTQVEKDNGQKYRIKRPNSERDRAIIYMLLDTGMRLGEMTRLRVGDVNLETGEVNIRPHRDGRKAKGRTVYLGTRTRQVIWRYTAKQQATIDMSVSFFNLTAPSIRHVVNRIGKNSGVMNVHPHRFRHTFAITYLRNGGDVFTLQRLLGHSTLDMTRRYLDIVRDDLQNVHKYASPVDNWKL